MFLDGDCPIGDEILELMIAEADPVDIEEIITEMVEPVKLFTMRGTGRSDFAILLEAFKYQ